MSHPATVDTTGLFVGTPTKAPRPFAPFEWMVAMRYLRGRRASGLVSVIAVISFLGIALGVFALIVIMSVMNGFHKELFNKIVGVNGHIFLQAADTPLTDFDKVGANARKVRDVELAIPLVEGYVGVSSTFAQAGGLLRGIREQDLKQLPGIVGRIKVGTLDRFDTAGGVVIGQGLAETLSLRVGDTLTILTAKGAQGPFGVMPRYKGYKVKAIFQIGMSQFDNLFIFLPLPEAQAFLNRDNEATVVELFLKNPERIDEARQAIDLAAERPIIMTDWRERNKTIFGALKVERNMMFVIVATIVLVASLSIISGLFMQVMDKSADIAIMRTMGASRGAVTRIFLITGTSIGIAGTLAGFLSGLLVAKNVDFIHRALSKLFGIDVFSPEVYFFTAVPSVVEPADVIAAVTLALGLSIAATIYPSWRAARLDPVEALRYG